MASAIDPSIVEREYEKLRPIYQCKSCSHQNVSRRMEDHVLEHMSTAPFACRKCKETYARREKARSHVTKSHHPLQFHECVDVDLKLNATFLQDQASQLQEIEAISFVHDRLARKQLREEASATSVKVAVMEIDAAPTSQVPMTPDVTLFAPSGDPLLASPTPSMPLPARPATSSFIMPVGACPRSPVSADARPSLTTNVAVDVCPSLPTTLDVMTQLVAMSETQSQILATLGTVRDDQLEIRRKVDKVEATQAILQREVVRCGQNTSAAQGESRRAGDRIAEVQRITRRIEDQGKGFIEAVKILQEAKQDLTRVTDSIKQVSVAQTTSSVRTKSMIREVMFGCQRGLEALENRPTRDHAARNDPGRTDREENSRRVLEL